jgi:YggT family protein
MINGYLTTTVLPIIWLVVSAIFGVFALLMVLRLIVNFSDPNPFGKIGRFWYKIRKITEKYVYPAMRFLATYRIDVRYAPLLTLVIALVITYFALQIIGSVCFIIDGLVLGIMAGSAKIIIGFILYALLSVLVLFIFIRVLSSWFVFSRKTFMGFVRRVTDPIILPVQRLIPPFGMIDISSLLVLILISFLQTIVLRTFVVG